MKLMLELICVLLHLTKHCFGLGGKMLVLLVWRRLCDCELLTQQSCADKAQT